MLRLYRFSVNFFYYCPFGFNPKNSCSFGSEFLFWCGKGRKRGLLVAVFWRVGGKGCQTFGVVGGEERRREEGERRRLLAHRGAIGFPSAFGRK